VLDSKFREIKEKSKIWRNSQINEVLRTDINKNIKKYNSILLTLKVLAKHNRNIAIRLCGEDMEGIEVEY
jgi:hypothetical protein